MWGQKKSWKRPLKAGLTRLAAIPRRPLLEFACCWLLGSSASVMLQGSRFWLLWAGIALVLPLLRILTERTWKQLMVALLVFTAAALYWQVNEARNVSHLSAALAMPNLQPAEQADDESLDGTIVQLKGTITSPPELDGDDVVFTAEIHGVALESTKSEWKRINKEKVRVQVRLGTEGEQKVAETWQRGRLVQLAGTLKQPSTARNFGGFDYRKYLHGKRIHWMVNVSGANSIHTEKGGLSTGLLLSYNDRLREAVGGRINRIFGDRNAGYMKGLLIGDTDELDPDVYQGFSALGLTHILAISGSHVAVNLAVLLWILRKLKMTRETALGIGMAFLPFYMLVTGLSPSVVRSGIMSLIGLYLLRKQRLKDGLHILAGTAFLMLLWEPYYLLDVSFQLSFAVTAGLIVFVPLLQHWFAFLPKRVAGAAAITFAAQLISFPLTIYYFNQFSLISLAANFVFVPLVSSISLPLGTAALLIGFLWLPLGKLLAYPVRFINGLTFDAVGWLESKSGFMTIWKSPSPGWICLYFVLIYILLRLARSCSRPQPSFEEQDETIPLNPSMNPALRHRSRGLLKAPLILKSGLCLLLVVLLGGLLYNGYRPAYAKGTGYVEFIDVGQGDCMLIVTPEGRHLLVDSGGTVSFRKASDAWRDSSQPYEVGAKVVVPLLKKRGVHSLDAVILTHWDQDHAGGLPAVLENIPVNALIVNGSRSDTATYREVTSLALLKKIPVYFAGQGLKLTPDAHTELEFLAPIQEGSGDLNLSLANKSMPLVEDQNDVSVVFLLSINNKHLLFTGDMSTEVEKSWLSRMQATRLANSDQTGEQFFPPIDVLKVAHHGSKTSTSAEWLKYWRPRLAVFSVGTNNTYGHPNPDVVNRVADSGAELLRTDEMGEIQLRIRAKDFMYRHKLNNS